MATVNTYLTFNGNCEEAFNFYKSVFGGDFAYIGRFGEMPEGDGYSVPEADKNKIMHVGLPIGNTILMGSDTGGDWAAKLIEGNNFSVSVNTESKEEADRIFNGLTAEGQITMPMENTFWGAYFGMLTDKFGIQWMVNFNH
ncbi:VOC family protein [Chryseobacterium lacus]|uniref:VOC family protein n=1 Tax=Chryseobacterium lacus TaxID=2058346 RepID=A0A368N2R4_9FLAO|nr:VOC family protein [Chryseobacterium lacus]RCU43914.1 VOC family protein [Chryseobacterium lacus]RST28842.1 VOC family protein [Chryseobacterium lacus]